MTSLSVSTAPLAFEEYKGKWVIREVRDRVELVIDGQGLAELVSVTELGSLEDQVTLFEPGGGDAVAFLSGRIRDESYVDPARIPLLGCACGDPLCGALTVKLSLGPNEVVWSEWAWDDQMHPMQALPTLPACRFEASEYADALLRAVGVAEANLEPTTTRMRVRRPGRWWQNLRHLPESRTDPETKLGWLHAEALMPSLHEADGDYAEFLINLDSAQVLLAGSDGELLGLSDIHRDEAHEALSAVTESPYRIRLPSPTLEAVQWYLDQF